MPIYLDHAATTPVRREVLEAMAPFWDGRFGNPSSVHRWGREARTALDEARERIAACMGAGSDEIVITSGGTEGDNLAILGVWRTRRKADGRNAVLTTPVEHKAVLGAVHQAAAEGADERICRMTRDGVKEGGPFAGAAGVGHVAGDDDVVQWIDRMNGGETRQDTIEPAIAARAGTSAFDAEAVLVADHVQVR